MVSDASSAAALPRRARRVALGSSPVLVHALFLWLSPGSGPRGAADTVYAQRKGLQRAVTDAPNERRPSFCPPQAPARVQSLGRVCLRCPTTSSVPEGAIRFCPLYGKIDRQGTAWQHRRLPRRGCSWRRNVLRMRILYERGRSVAAVYLAGYAVECALKAYLQKSWTWVPDEWAGRARFARAVESVSDFVSLPWETPRGIVRTSLSDGIRGCGTMTRLILYWTPVYW